MLFCQRKVENISFALVHKQLHLTLKTNQPNPWLRPGIQLATRAAVSGFAGGLFSCCFLIAGDRLPRYGEAIAQQCPASVGIGQEPERV